MGFGTHSGIRTITRMHPRHCRAGRGASRRSTGRPGADRPPRRGGSRYDRVRRACSSPSEFRHWNCGGDGPRYQRLGSNPWDRLLVAECASEDGARLGPARARAPVETVPGPDVATGVLLLRLRKHLWEDLSSGRIYREDGRTWSRCFVRTRPRPPPHAALGANGRGLRVQGVLRTKRGARKPPMTWGTPGADFLAR